ncbi:MAG TPA: hypothetical protein VNJ51_05560 [Candidatus Dormibacteraeota bacterium]|nr:hypothetical protein [Candidatus Dormibacteraeota bacterium]
MSAQRPWYLHRTLIFIVVMLMLWCVWVVYSGVSAHQKMSAEIRAELASGRPVSLWVELPFAPEEFHIKYFQARGTLTGVEGDWVHLRDVEPAAAWSIARQYWVRRVAAHRGGSYAVLQVR